MNSEKINKMVGTGVLTAVVIVVYLLTMGISVGPFNITFALIPIVVGAALYGWATGGWLGLVFGAMVLFTGGANAFLVINVPGSRALRLVLFRDLSTALSRRRTAGLRQYARLRQLRSLIPEYSCWAASRSSWEQ